MQYPHIATGKHMDWGDDPRFRINTSPGIMRGVNEAHGSFLQRYQVVELRDELNSWLAQNPTAGEQVRSIVGDKLPERSILRLIRLVDKKQEEDAPARDED